MVRDQSRNGRYITMRSTRISWLSAAQGADWFQLNRHDDPDPADPDDPNPADPKGDPDPQDPATDPPPSGPDPEPDPEGVDQLGDAGKKALDRMKEQLKAAKQELNELRDTKSDAVQTRQARKDAAEARKRADDLARKVAEFEDEKKSELEKATAKAERLADQAAKATARAVQAEVKALSTGKFADPMDAAESLMRDPSQYVLDNGDIDTDAIQTALDDLLDRKPHWGRPEPAAPTPEPKPRIKPDPGQGARPPTPATDFRTAPKEEVAAELAKYGFRQRY